MHNRVILANLDLGGDLVERIQAADPGAATPLYDRFASGVRALVRHKLPDADAEVGVFSALVTAARAIRKGKVQDADQLVVEVRAAANAFIKEAKAAPESGSNSRLDQLQRLLKELEPWEREILKRLYFLGQAAPEVGRQMKISSNAVMETKRKLRNRFLTQSKS